MRKTDLKVNHFFNAIFLFWMFASCDSTPTNQAQTQPAIDTSLRSTPTPVDSYHVVKPGERVGFIVLDSSTDKLMKILGKPDFGDAAMGHSLNTWIKNSDTISIFSGRQMGVDETNRIERVRITAENYKTPEGIGVGSKLPKIAAEYPALKKEGVYTDAKDTFRIFSTPYGIAFEVDKFDRCTGVIVSKPTSQETAAYMPFHTNLKKIQH